MSWVNLGKLTKNFQRAAKMSANCIRWSIPTLQMAMLVWTLPKYCDSYKKSNIRGFWTLLGGTTIRYASLNNIKTPGAGMIHILMDMWIIYWTLFNPHFCQLPTLAKPRILLILLSSGTKIFILFIQCLRRGRCSFFFVQLYVKIEDGGFIWLKKFIFYFEIQF